MLSDRDSKRIARRLKREGVALEKEREQREDKAWKEQERRHRAEEKEQRRREREIAEVLDSQDKVRDVIAGKIIPLEGGFARFCRKVGLWNVCSCPLGRYGSDWEHYELRELDKQIIKGSLDDMPTYIFCSQFPKGSDDFGVIGQPVFDTKRDRVILEKVSFDNLCDMMKIDLTTVHGEVGEQMLLSTFIAREPRLVGIGRYDKTRGEYEIHEVEIVPPAESDTQRKNLFQRMLERIFGL